MERTNGSAERPNEFEEYWKEHYKRLTQYCVRLGLSPQDAEEIAATALFHAWRHRASVGNVKSYLTTACRHGASRLWRSAARKREFVPRHPLGSERGPRAEVADPAELTHVRLDAARLEAEVQSAIRELQPPTAREVVRLRLQEGRAYDAIAGEVGIPEGTAKIWVHRFRRRFGGSRPGAAE